MWCSYLEDQYVTEFWKITAIRIFELSMMLWIEEATFKNTSTLKIYEFKKWK